MLGSVLGTISHLPFSPERGWQRAPGLGFLMAESLTDLTAAEKALNQR